MAHSYWMNSSTAQSKIRYSSERTAPEEIHYSTIHSPYQDQYQGQQHEQPFLCLEKGLRSSVDLSQNLAHLSLQHYLPDSLSAAGRAEYIPNPMPNHAADPPSQNWEMLGSAFDHELQNNVSTLDNFDFDSDFLLFPTSADFNAESFGVMNFFPDMDFQSSEEVSSTTEKYGCEQCPRTFSKRHQLNRHLRTHTKPFKCDQPGCSASFAEKRGRDRHTKSRHDSFATDKDIVKCRFCKYTSTRPDAVQRHLRKKHGVQVSRTCQLRSHQISQTTRTAEIPQMLY